MHVSIGQYSCYFNGVWGHYSLCIIVTIFRSLWKYQKWRRSDVKKKENKDWRCYIKHVELGSRLNTFRWLKCISIMRYLLHTSVYGAPRIIPTPSPCILWSQSGSSSHRWQQCLEATCRLEATWHQVLDIERCINHPVSIPYLVKWSRSTLTGLPLIPETCPRPHSQQASLSYLRHTLIVLTHR